MAPNQMLVTQDCHETADGKAERARLGWHLKRWREASRFTQAQVSRRTGIVQHQISRLEHDQVEKPSMADLVRIAAVYGVNPDTLATVAGWWTPPRDFTSEDNRWTYVRHFLATSGRHAVEQFLDWAYDRALFLEEMGRTHPRGTSHEGGDRAR